MSEPTADQRRVHANLAHRFGSIRLTDVAAWPPEHVAEAGEWLAAGGGPKSPDVPAFVAEAVRAARETLAELERAELAAAARELIAAALAKDAAVAAHAAATARLLAWFGKGVADANIAPIVCDGYLISRESGRFAIRRARVV